MMDLSDAALQGRAARAHYEGGHGGCSACAVEIESVARALLEVRDAARAEQRLFPVQSGTSYGKPHPTQIPWSIADKAYSVYRARYSGQSLERLAERGGFSAEEMDEFHPQWIAECFAIAKARAEQREEQKDLISAAEHFRYCDLAGGELEHRCEECTTFAAVLTNVAAIRGKP